MLFRNKTLFFISILKSNKYNDNNKHSTTTSFALRSPIFKRMEVMPIEEQAEYIPDRGLGAILREIGDVRKTLKIKFIREEGNDESVKFELYNISDIPLYFEDKHVDNGARCVFSAFFTDHSILGIEHYTPVQFKRKEEFTEKLSIYCKIDPNEKRMIITDPGDLNARLATFAPIIKKEILVDPFTWTLINGCSISFVPKITSKYAIDYITVMEELKDVEDLITVENRRDSIKKAIEYIEKRKVMPGEKK